MNNFLLNDNEILIQTIETISIFCYFGKFKKIFFEKKKIINQLNLKLI